MGDLTNRTPDRACANLGDWLAGLAVSLLGVGAFVGAAFLNLLETTR